jgi:glycosyltransferase involved in cell wall biosynthesis
MRRWESKEIPGNPKVGMIVAAYMRPHPLACLLHSFLAQTYQNFEILVVHDGPGAEIRRTIETIQDDRIRYVETLGRHNQYGHPQRQLGIDLCTADYIGISNDDNYYVPVYFEWMLHQLFEDQAQFVFCNFVRSHKLWQPWSAKPEKGQIDCGAWIAAADLVQSTRWTDTSFSGDGTFIEDLVSRAKRITKLDAYLFVHI